MKKDVVEVYKELDTLVNKEIVLEGWVRNHRKQKEFGFIDFNDGTYFQNVQIVYDSQLEDFLEIQKLKSY